MLNAQGWESADGNSAAVPQNEPLNSF